ncbi:FtsK/SpoIIIE domain-containing protein [Streptococcus uberis]|uniref:FtsK/SpoIIIE domain-containing protein n=1 Tax=Streptococcus uberis TaxID=1349 RepID=UPI0037A7C6F8
MKKISANWKYPFWGQDEFIVGYILSFIVFSGLCHTYIENYLDNKIVIDIYYIYLLILPIEMYGIVKKKWYDRYWRIREFIKTNKLCIKEIDKEGKEIFIESVSASWIEDKETDTIRFYKKGTLFDAKVNELEERLESMLRKTLYKKIIQITYTDYIFLKRPDRRIYLSKDDFEDKSCNTLMKLSERISYDISKCSHGLTVGSTGSGKTFFINSKILFYAQMNADIYICDPKNADLSLIKFIENFPEDNVAASPNQICKILRIVNKRMEGRYSKYFNSVEAFGKTYKDFGLNPIVVIIDEYSSFVRTSEQTLIKEAKEYIYSIIMKGRQIGIFIEFLLQRPDAEVLDGAIRDQLGCRVALGNMSKEGYNMVFGMNDVDYRNIVVKGGGYVMLNGILEKPIYFETPFFDEDISFIEELSKFYN